ncbi:transcription antitermination factor NusB [Magnetospira sp. QH-2]|uniref:transcription antitermination factor NusB n=1 Tax=Magnetospira sp. (strain QH-2) TaxID=1288970 RepID=UPI0003E810FD|nr:transcription antitermination factor NusB [Magnetospira sp. QH-2]CCQ73826.1 antitermination factor (L factor) (N utilization substance protein B) [Magnetospira sp. QH-2]
MSDSKSQGTQPGDGGSRRRSAARLAAVQALYEIDMSGAGLNGVIDEFLHKRWTGADLTDGEGVSLPEPDGNYFGLLLRGAHGRQADLDAMIDGALSGGYSVHRLEAVLRATLRVGTYELLDCPKVPARVVITEYVDLTGDFFLAKEPGLVNGVLDRLARTLRADEMAREAG